jgi:ATP-dependent protease ClpP protease subunit
VKYLRRLCPFLIGLVLMIPAWSRAADIRITRMDEKHGFATIRIIGAIDEADVARFKSILDMLKVLGPYDVIEVEVNSPGGKVIPAMEILPIRLRQGAHH